MATAKDRFKLKNGLNVDVETGIAPIVTPSTTLNENFNADLLDGEQGSWYLNTSSGSQSKDGNLTLNGKTTFTGVVEQDYLGALPSVETTTSLANQYNFSQSSRSIDQIRLTLQQNLGVTESIVLDASGISLATADSAVSAEIMIGIDGKIDITPSNSTIFKKQVFFDTSSEQYASINIPAGPDPLNPQNGDIWSSLTEIKTHLNGETYAFARNDKVVHLAGIETINGPKTFKSQLNSPIVTIEGKNDGQPTVPYFIVQTSQQESVLDINDTRVSIGRTIEVLPATAADIPLIIKSRASQTGDLQQWKDEEGNDIVRIDATGHIYADKVTTESDVLIGGNLTVNGTTTTIHSIIATVTDPVITLGGDTPPTEYDSKDRGVEFRWHDGTSAQLGFFGFDHSTKRMTFIPYATNAGEIFSGDIGGLDADHIEFVTDPNAVDGVARLRWNDIDGTLNLGLKGGNSVLEIGQELLTRVYNADTEPLVDGDIVSISGSHGDRISVVRAIASGVSAATNVLGMVTEPIEVGAEGFVSVQGRVRHLHTFIDGTKEGAEIWLSPTTLGGWTVDRPDAPNQAIRIGYIQKEDLAEGIIFVNVEVGGGSLALLHDVGLGSLVDWDILRYDQSTDTWTNTDISTVVNALTNIDIQNLNISGTLTAGGFTNLKDDLDVDGDINFDGGNLTTSAATVNFVNTATTLNLATSATDIQIGAATGTTNVNNSLDVDGDVNIDGGDLTVSTTTFNLANTTATTVNFAGDATNIQIGSASGTTNVNNNLDVDGDLNIDGGDLTASTSSFNLITSPTTVNFATSATTLEIGAATGTTNINNNLDVDGTLNVDGQSITTSSSVFNIANANAETINFGGAATDIQIGSSSGTTNINNNLDVDGDVNIDGGDLTVSTPTFNLANTTATTLNIGGAATDIQIGSSTGTTNVNNNLDVDGDINIDGGDLTASTPTFNLLHTPTTINFGAAATDIQIGSATGTTNVNNDLDVDGDVNIDGGDLTVSSATFNLANTNATTVNFAGAATTVEIGAATGTTNVNNNLDVDGDLNVDGGDFTTSATTFNLLNNTATTVNFAGSATDVQIGAATGITNINNNADIDGNLNVDGGSLTSNLTNFNLLKENVQYLDFALSAIDLKMGATTGKTTIRNSVDIDGSLEIKGITTTFNPPTVSAPFTIGTNAFDQLVAGLNADKLDSQTGSWYQARENHTGTQPHGTISDWAEAVQDTVAPMFVHSQQTGITVTYNDDSGRIIMTVTGGGGGGVADLGLTYWMGV